MLYQIDVSKKIENLSDSFIAASLANRSLHRNMYYVAAEKDEAYDRMAEYKKNPSKTYHLEWVEKHKNLFDENMMGKIWSVHLF